MMQKEVEAIVEAEGRNGFMDQVPRGKYFDGAAPFEFTTAPKPRTGMWKQYVMLAEYAKDDNIDQGWESREDVQPKIRLHLPHDAYGLKEWDAARMNKALAE